MPGIYYPDLKARSPDGRFLLGARSPHNGTIRHCDGSRPTDEEFGYKYRTQQREFRYRLIDTRTRPHRVVWERWQEGGEESPHALHVIDRGWSILRTQGQWPQVIAIDRRGGETASVNVVAPFDTDRMRSSEPVWVARHVSFSVGDRYWSMLAWPYFLRWKGKDYFVCRAFWGQRLVIDLREGALVADEGPAAPAALPRRWTAARHATRRNCSPT